MVLIKLIVEHTHDEQLEIKIEGGTKEGRVSFVISTVNNTDETKSEPWLILIQ